MEIYLHTYCRRDYASIVSNKIKKFRASGLWDKINTLFIPISGVREFDMEFFEELASFSDKIQLVQYENPVFNNEPDTLNFIKLRAEDLPADTPILYMHTKGVTYTHPQLRQNVESWVRYLDLYTIAKWEECVEALKTHDTASGLYVEKPRHYSGNFWWANAGYIKTLPYLNKENIKPLERGEFWICSGENAKCYSLAPNGPIDRYQNNVVNESDFPTNF